MKGWCSLHKQFSLAMWLGYVFLGLPVIPALSQNIFQSGSTGADGALIFYSPPPGRDFHAMAYDANRQVVVLFGGSGAGGTLLNETWEWNNTRWTLKNTLHKPSARVGHRMVYDSTRQVIVLFGGTSSTVTADSLGDTWEYDGIDWVLKSPPTSPAARNTFMIAYHGQRVVLFGGLSASGQLLGDTWEYDGTGWNQKAPPTAPSARFGAAMIYDSLRQVTVLFGGRISSSSLILVNETWEYNGTTWLQRAPVNRPSVRQLNGSMIYDSTRQIAVLFGGFNGAFIGDTWEYNGINWTSYAPSRAPSARFSHAMAYDSLRQATVLFGGSTTTETWLWNGSSWFAPLQTQINAVFDMSSRPDGIWHYTTIDIPAGTRVSFQNNQVNTPVVWLATGAVRIAGEINLDGSAGRSGSVDPGNEAPGGPGGYAGGLGGRRADISGSNAGSPGGGPGGGFPGTAVGQTGGDGGHGTPGASPRGGVAYGDRLLRPLTGGSGGGGGASSSDRDGGSGGGGGGAILIASSDTMQLSGIIHASGGSGSQVSGGSTGGKGSGGAIRLVANRIEGTGSLQAAGGGTGRIRVEAYFIASSLSTNPLFVTAPPLSLNLASAHAIRITRVAGEAVQQPPGGSLTTPDVIFVAAGNVTISLETTNIPEGTPITVRITAGGQVITVQSTPTDAAGNATATAMVPAGVGTLQAFGTYTVTP
ncbi:MAG: kelch repeat-containing protein [Candidatus Tectimicrobiota bacterium]